MVCITQPEIKAIVDQALSENNIKRDQKWEDRFFELQEKFEASIRKHLEHLKTAPETKDKFNLIDIRCAERGQQIVNMKEKIEIIDKKVDKIQDNITWLVRLVIGTIIAAILAVILKG